MVRLFYKDLKAHESAYRNTRADEAVNDLLLGAKLSTLNNLEEAKNKSVDEVATNFGKFLKALGTKEVPLFDRLNKVEDRLFKALEAKTGDAAANARSEADKEKINEAIAVTDNNRNPASVLSKVKLALSGTTDAKNQQDHPLVQAFTRAMQTKGYNASSSKKNDRKAATIDAIKDALQIM